MDTYISKDVPNAIRSQLLVDNNTAHWAIGGFSYGGTCSIQMATNHPDLYPTFVDAAGEAEPTLGTRQQTVDTAFGGDEAKFKASTKLLQNLVARYPQIVAFSLVGSHASYFLELREAIPQRVKFYCGVPEFTQHATLGAAGYINPAGNIIPYLCRSLIDAWMAGDLKQVSKSNHAIQSFLRIVNQWAPSTARWVKMGMKVMGTDSGSLRLPYLLPPAEELQKMADQFAGMRLRELEAEAKAYVHTRG